MSLEKRPYAKDYSGLINQAAVAGIVAVLCFGGQELLKRRRRGKVVPAAGLGSVESWEFGYLYQARSWAKNPSPPPPKTWPLAWVKEVINFPEEKVNELRGVDASFYVRFLRGCVWWTLAQTLLIFPILLPIHYLYSPDPSDPSDPSYKLYAKTSLLRADISSLVKGGRGQHLLWIHLVLIYWVTFSWMATIWWIVRGTLTNRALRTAAAVAKAASISADEETPSYHAHPHPQFGFQALPPVNREGWNRGLRHRTIIVTNLPVQLRSERELREYFEYYLARHVDVPAIGLPPSVQPGLINKLVAFVYNRAKKYKDHIPKLLYPRMHTPVEDFKLAPNSDAEEASKRQTSRMHQMVQIDRVSLVRKMTELAALMQRREDVLVCLEAAHIKLARTALEAVKAELKKRAECRDQSGIATNRGASQILLRRMKNSLPEIHVEEASGFEHDLGRDAKQGEGRMDLLVRILGPFVESTGWEAIPGKSSPMRQYRQHLREPSDVSDNGELFATDGDKTVWDALLSFPRSTLNEFQPLIHLNRMWRGKTVPAIDYYAAKLNVLNSLIMELRAIDLAHVQPASTAFVTFKDPADARRACKYLTVHPGNPLACLVTMAPCYEDLDWGRLMKTAYRSEIVKDWVVGVGVWGFTIFWLVPVTLLLGLINIENFAKVWPKIGPYFERHQYLSTVVSSFLPTVLVAGLAILVPLILLLIAKKAHTIITLSELHDRIMTRYYKWLILNVLIFFCTGTTILTSFFLRFRESTSAERLITLIQQSFPTGGPFYVGWLIFTTAMHGGFEIVLLGLPLLVYPSTRSQVTPRKRSVGIRPRTLNYYYWLPNHLLVIHVLVVFAVLNPLVLPFGLLYFSVEYAVLKNQLIHVYAKHYEGNAKLLIIRLIRYSFDGLMLAQVVFIAFMSIEKKTVNIVLGSLLLTFTLLAKLVATRLCRNKFEEDDLAEAIAICGDAQQDTPISRPETPDNDLPPVEVPDLETTQIHPSFWTWRFPGRMSFGHYTNMPAHHAPPAARRQPIPFGSGRQAFTRLRSMDLPKADMNVQPDARAAASMPVLDSKGSNSWPPSAAASVPSTEIPSFAPPIEEPTSAPRRMVAEHAPHPAWDDESDPDQPYDNPYMTRQTANVLWLPRDPLGILDLDDTVDMFKCLTSAPGLGSLGHYGDEGEEDDMGVLSMLSAMDSIDERDGIQMGEAVQHQLQEPFLQSNPHLVESPDGMMSPPLSVVVPDTLVPDIQVDVPEVIRVRERTATEIEDAEGKPTEIPLISKRISISDTNRPNRVSRGPSSSPRRSATTGNQVRATSGYRSFSGGSRMSRFSIRSPSSHMSGSDHLSSVATPMTEDGFSTRPAFRNQASFTRSTLTIIHATSPASDVASVSRRSSRASRQGPLSEAGTARYSAHTRYATSHVTAHEAVIEEAIAEERDAAEVREAKEQQEAEQAEQGPAWWKAWAFTNTQASQPPPSMAV